MYGLVYEMDGYEAVCKHFHEVAEAGVIVVGRDGDILYRTLSACGSCTFCERVNTTHDARERCRLTPAYGGHQARRFGGKYIFFCHRGLAHFTSPVFTQGKFQYALSCGPFLMVDHEDYLHSDVAVYHRTETAKASEQTEQVAEQATATYTESGTAASETVLEALREPLSLIPVLPTKKVHALSELLYYCAGYMGQAAEEPPFDFIKDQPLPAVITEYIERIQAKGDTGFYPLQKEDDLLAAMVSGDVITAKTMLNELLGYIFFYSGMRFDVIRSRVLELIVLLSRAAVKGGADAELIFGLNYEYLREISTFDNIEDLSYWLSMIMNRFTDYVFHFVDVKHADVIYKAIDYIKANYMKKLTLEDAARAVFLSPAYFSRIFKEETGYNFSGYLNKARIDESKKLLRNERINLADIAGMVGYEDQSYFSKVFKKMTGMTPLKFRQSRGQA